MAVLNLLLYLLCYSPNKYYYFHGPTTVSPHLWDVCAYCYNFLAILISNCHTLTRLNLSNITFCGPEPMSGSSRQQIRHLLVSEFNFETIKALVDTVDFTHLQQLHDMTEWNHNKDSTLEDYQELIQCYQHLLSKSKYSLSMSVCLHI